MAEQAIPGGVHLSTDAYTRLLARVVQAEAKVRRAEGLEQRWLADADALWALPAAELHHALSGDAAPRTDGDTR